MATRYVRRSSGGPAGSTGSHSGIGVDSNDNRLKYRTSNGIVELAVAGNPDGEVRYVSTSGSDTNNGLSWGSAYASVQAAENAAAAGDVILVAAGEYDEDVVVDTSTISIVGVGPRHSVRITGTAAGTATGMTLDGVSDVGLYNLNIEGRSGGAGLVFTGQIRRVEVVGCKLHGGDTALSIQSPSSAQTVDVRVEDCVFASAATGVEVAYSGGDPCHQIRILRCVFDKITTDAIKEDGATHDWLIDGNTFKPNGTSDITRYLDINETGSNGFVTNNVFATTVFSTAKFALASGVIFANNISEQENPSAGQGGSSGRPD
jgi:hypothetical protein